MPTWIKHISSKDAPAADKRSMSSNVDVSRAVLYKSRYFVEITRRNRSASRGAGRVMFRGARKFVRLNSRAPATEDSETRRTDRVTRWFIATALTMPHVRPIRGLPGNCYSRDHVREICGYWNCVRVMDMISVDADHNANNLSVSIPKFCNTM